MATHKVLQLKGYPQYFYPRPPRGGRRGADYTANSGGENFYPRPPRGGRHVQPGAVLKDCIFLSTPSARRATQTTCKRVCGHTHFYPRPPRGGRHAETAKTIDGLKFLSTPSARRATFNGSQFEDVVFDISIHALREEGD